MIIKKNTLFGILALILIIGVGYFVFASGSPSGKVVLNSGEAQIIKMHVENGQYVFEPSEVRSGSPVRIEADITRMPGCSKTVVASGLGITKTLTDQDNVIEFTPSKAGTFNFACSMNMYNGKLTILEDNGVKSNYVEKTTASTGMACGSGSGCGCGG